MFFECLTLIIFNLVILPVEAGWVVIISVPLQRPMATGLACVVNTADLREEYGTDDPVAIENTREFQEEEIFRDDNRDVFRRIRAGFRLYSMFVITQINIVVESSLQKNRCWHRVGSA